MSGGSLNYISNDIENNLVGAMEDIELNEMMKDLVVLTHKLEWYSSGDVSEGCYLEEKKQFKKKWFDTPREERLEHIIDEKLSDIKSELMKSIQGE